MDNNHLCDFDLTLQLFSHVFCLYLIPLAGVPPMVLQRILEILTYLATNHSAVADMLCYFNPSHIPDTLRSINMDNKKDKGKAKVEEGIVSPKDHGKDLDTDIPLVLFLKLLSRPLFLRSAGHLEQVY